MCPREGGQASDFCWGSSPGFLIFWIAACAGMTKGRCRNGPSLLPSPVGGLCRGWFLDGRLLIFAKLKDTQGP